MATAYGHIDGCKCAMCDYIRDVRAEKDSPDWDHKEGCTCSNCAHVRELGDARQQGREDARKAKAYKFGFEKEITD